MIDIAVKCCINSCNQIKAETSQYGQKITAFGLPHRARAFKHYCRHLNTRRPSNTVFNIP